MRVLVEQAAEVSVEGDRFVPGEQVAIDDVADALMADVLL